MSLISAQNFLERMKSDLSFMKIHNTAKTAMDRERLINEQGYRFSDEELSVALDMLMSEMLAKPYSKSA